MPRCRTIVISLSQEERLELEGRRRQAETIMYSPSASSQAHRDARLLERRIRIVLRANAGDSVATIAKTAPTRSSTSHACSTPTSTAAWPRCNRAGGGGRRTRLAALKSGRSWSCSASTPSRRRRPNTWRCSTSGLIRRLPCQRSAVTWLSCTSASDGGPEKPSCNREWRDHPDRFFLVEADQCRRKRPCNRE
jgi:hypothetical protein